MSSRAMLAACLFWVVPAAVYAQQFNPRARNQPKQPAMERFAADGTIEMVAPGRILMLSASNQKWMIWLHREAEISVTGTAEVDFLKAGHFIEFSATLDKRGNVKEEIAELTITTPSQTHPLGVWPGAIPGGAGGLAPGGDDRFGAGNAPGMGGGRAPGAGGAAPAPTTNIYTIHGRVARCRKGKLTVVTPRGTFKIELQDEPNIQVKFADYSCARKGDKISVTKGLMPPMNPGMPQATLGQAQALALTIELSEPLTGQRKPSKPTRPVAPPPEPKDPGGDRAPFEISE